MLQLTGYLDRFSARPGETIAVKVSSHLETPYRADLVRIVHADPNPAGPGLKILDATDEWTPDWAGDHHSRVQAVRLGSCAVARLGADGLISPEAWTLSVRVQPRIVAARRQTVVALRGSGGGTGTGLALSIVEGGAALELRDGAGGLERARIAARMLPRQWYELRVTCDGTRVHLLQIPLARNWGAEDRGEARLRGARWTAETLVIGADLAAPGGADGARHRDFLDGRVEDPLLLRGFQAGAAPLDAEAFAGSPDLLAWWDFAEGIPGKEIRDRGPGAWHGELVNLPTRAVLGSRWTGREMSWRHAPREYAAIHFHSDDLEDCGWETDFAVPVPARARSGVYGVRLRGAGQEDIIPFYVLPPRGTATAPVAFLASTFTYQAYANHARGNADAAYRARRAAWGAYPHNPDEHPEYARSTYNRHPDDTGVCYSSQFRPMLTMRPGFLTFNDARGSGLRHFPADSHLTDWLEAKGFAFDVITDHDLDREGAELLGRYRAVLTGSHPEYHTPRTLDALQDYVGGGGRLCYLGGNGFYWRIANSDAVPGVIEIRRAEGGIRAWSAEPGEYWHALDGGYGGLWRRNGRPPQRLAGVGFSGQGLFEGTHYRRMPGAEDPRAAWIMEGVTDAIIGDFGLSGGGAAGFELDRADPRLGSPPSTIILARSEGHQAHFVTVPEELLSHLHTESGEDPASLVRAEIIYFETDGGGAVFSTGSITFCGSLSHNGYDNPVSRMLENVVRRFGEYEAS